MAKAPSEKMRQYRERLKERGGKAIQITLSPEWVNALELIEKYNYPGFGTENTVKAMLNADFTRIRLILNEQVKLREEFNADDETISGYVQNEIERHSPLKAEQYLELINKGASNAP
jgi:hypothetical protein